MSFVHILRLAGGLAFFLYGMNVMSQGLEKMAGGRLEGILQSMTSSRFRGMVLGAAVTAVIQSSSAVTVMLVGLVNSGIMALEQTVGVIMGANIGTTVTAWLLSLVSIEGDSLIMQMLKPANFSLALALIGVVLLMTAKKQKKKDLGVIMMGFAVLMYGMEMMSGAVAPLKDMPGFADLFLMFENPILGVLAGAVLTGIIQSSSASVGILQALAATGVISYGAAIPIIMGQNIGTCVTAVISGVGASRSARKVSIIHISFNLIGTAVFLSLFWLGNLLFAPAFVGQAIDPAGIAFCHSVFNICTTALLLPFGRYLVKIADHLIRTEEKPVRVSEELLDERILSVPSVTITACGKLTEQMAEAACYAASSALDMLDKPTFAGASALLEGEETLDLYEDRLGQYLMQISGQGLSDKDSRQRFKMQHVIGDFERIGDHAINLLDLSKNMEKSGLQMSEEGRKQLYVLRSALHEILDLTRDAYQKNDTALAVRVEPLEQVLDGLIRRMRDEHLQRVNAGVCTLQLGVWLSEVLSNFERISDHCSNIAVAIIEAASDRYDSHHYLESIKTGQNDDFRREYHAFSRKYHL